MLSYTQDTLKAALMLWNRNSAPEFEATLGEIIQKGELALMRAIDFDPVLSENDTTTTASATEVFKPGSLLDEKSIWVTVAGVRTAVLKRSRDFIKYITRTPGTPRYYAELDETRWEVAPPALDAYLLTVTGQYAPPSIMDGDGTTTSYFSTVIPDLLYIACAIEACDFLKFWDRKSNLIQDFVAKVSVFKGETSNQEATDGGDSLANRQQSNPVKGPGA